MSGYVLKLANKRKAIWAKRRWAADPEWREKRKVAWRERYYKLKEEKEAKETNKDEAKRDGGTIKETV